MNFHFLARLSQVALAFVLWLLGSLLKAQPPSLPPQYGEEGSPVRIGYVLDYAGGPQANENIHIREGAELLLRKAFEGSTKRQLHIIPHASVEGLNQAIAAGRVDMWQMGALQFIETRDPQRGPVLAVPQFGKEKLSRYFLVTEKGTPLEDLKGRNLHSIFYGELGQALQWLEIELQERGHGRPEHFFGRVKKIVQGSPGEAILPTFFGETDACLVREDQFELLVRLNPQIRKVLEPILVSEPMLGLVVVARADYEHKLAREMGTHACRVHESRSGQIGLNVLKMSRFAAFDEEDFSSLRALSKRRARTKPDRPSPVTPATR